MSLSRPVVFLCRALLLLPITSTTFIQRRFFLTHPYIFFFSLSCKTKVYHKRRGLNCVNPLISAASPVSEGWMWVWTAVGRVVQTRRNDSHLTFLLLLKRSHVAFVNRSHGCFSYTRGLVNSFRVSNCPITLCPRTEAYRPWLQS